MLNTGRGIDRYAYYINSNCDKSRIEYDVIATPWMTNPFERLLVGDPLITSRIASNSASLFHAVSPVGARLALLRGRRPLITTIHDVIPFFLSSYSPMKYNFLRWCITISARISDKIIVPFKSTGDYLVERLRIDSRKITVVNLGIDLSKFSPKKNIVTSSRKKILFLGGAFPRMRGGDTLLKAFSKISKKITDCELIVVGTGSEQDIIKKLATKLELRSKVKFLDFIPEGQMPEYFQQADVFVYPSRLGFGFSVMQAMACGTPVITSDALDLPEFVNAAGIICPTEDSDSFAEALLSVLASDHHSEYLATKGYERVRQFSVNDMLSGTQEVYETMLTQRPN